MHKSGQTLLFEFDDTHAYNAGETSQVESVDFKGFATETVIQIDPATAYSHDAMLSILFTSDDNITPQKAFLGDVSRSNVMPGSDVDDTIQVVYLPHRPILLPLIAGSTGAINYFRKFHRRFQERDGIGYVMDDHTIEPSTTLTDGSLNVRISTEVDIACLRRHR